MIESLFESVEECSSEIEAKVRGILPYWLKGNLLRIGPGKWDLKNGFTLNHWLDGCAFLVNFRIENGRVFFSSRFLRSDAYKKMMTVDRPVFTEFGTRAYSDPSKNVFSRILSSIVPCDFTDNTVSNIYVLNNDIFVGTESCYVWRIDQLSLEAVEKINLEKLFGVSILTSHPLFSQADMCFYNIGTNFLTGIKYNVFQIPYNHDKAEASDKSKSFSKASLLCSIPSSYKTGFTYIHSFGMTINYIVLIEHPLIVNAFKLAACTVRGRSLEECLEWRPEETTKFFVIEKSSGRVLPILYQTRAFFFFHVINAYEEIGFLVLDLIGYDDVSILEEYHIKCLRTNDFRNHKAPVARRYVLPLEARLCNTNLDSENLVTIYRCKATARINDKAVWLQAEELAPPGFELPSINPRFSGLKHRFIYGTGTFEKGFFANSAAKIDLLTSTIKVWKDQNSMYPSELVFVSRPDSMYEDDGVVLCLVLDSNLNSNHFLAVLDSSTMCEIARASIPRTKAQIPPTIHGLFISSS